MPSGGGGGGGFGVKNHVSFKFGEISLRQKMKKYSFENRDLPGISQRTKY